MHTYIWYEKYDRLGNATVGECSTADKQALVEVKAAVEEAKVALEKVAEGKLELVIHYIHAYI